jgi:hypothetical protein
MEPLGYSEFVITANGVVTHAAYAGASYWRDRLGGFDAGRAGVVQTQLWQGVFRVGVMAMASGRVPALIGVSAVLVAVRIGTTTPLAAT